MTPEDLLQGYVKGCMRFDVGSEGPLVAIYCNRSGLFLRYPTLLTTVYRPGRSPTPGYHGESWLYEAGKKPILPGQVAFEMESGGDRIIIDYRQSILELIRKRFPGVRGRTMIENMESLGYKPLFTTVDESGRKRHSFSLRPTMDEEMEASLNGDYFSLLERRRTRRR
jgi:hypothetical protein